MHVRRAEDLPPGAPRPNTDLERRVGNTPLLRLRTLEPRSTVEIYAKAEWTNPGGSVKDRAALAMIRDGEQTGLLTPGRTLLDASSGNTGLAYAMFGGARGYRVTIVMPSNATSSRIRVLRELRAELVLTDPQGGMDEAIAVARGMAAEAPERIYYPNQYDNPANWEAHYLGTGPEILRQTGGRVTHFVAGLGTTGTFTGTGRALREQEPSITLIAVQPDSPLHALEGLKHLPSTDHVPAIYDPRLVDGEEIVSTEEAQRVARALWAHEGLRVGPSAAAAAAAAARTARRLEAGVVVTVFPDDAGKYLDEPFWRG